jgi:MFS family permease
MSDEQHHEHPKFSVLACLVTAIGFWIFGWISGPVFDHVLGFKFQLYAHGWNDIFFVLGLVVYMFGHIHAPKYLNNRKYKYNAIWLRYADNRFSMSHMHRHPWGDKFCYLDEERKVGFIILNSDGTVINDQDSTFVVAWKHANKK